MTATPGATDTPPFEGFRSGQRAQAIPVQFFTEVLPQVTDPEELRVTLYALYAINRPGRVAAMRVSELAAEPPLARAHGDATVEDARALVAQSVAAAVARGVLLALALEDGDTLVLVNHDAGRRLRDRIASGAEAVPGAPGTRGAGGASARVAAGGGVPAGRPAAVYEQEIGTLTPSVAASLAEAEQRYPPGWIADALREAARQNKRAWAYAEAILRRWDAEGRDDEATEGHAAGARGRPDPYAHLYHRD
ncbi:MAG: DnaD domain protein, partial [Dehalococcoidia bacterium]